MKTGCHVKKHNFDHQQNAENILLKPKDNHFGWSVLDMIFSILRVRWIQVVLNSSKICDIFSCF